MACWTLNTGSNEISLDEDMTVVFRISIVFIPANKATLYMSRHIEKVSNTWGKGLPDIHRIGHLVYLIIKGCLHCGCLWWAFKVTCIFLLFTHSEGFVPILLFQTSCSHFPKLVLTSHAVYFPWDRVEPQAVSPSTGYLILAYGYISGSSWTWLGKKLNLHFH